MKVPINNNQTFEVRILTNKDTLSIQNIWRECFTQDNNYINNFIEYCFPHSISWGIFPSNSKNAVAMLSLLPSYTILEQTPNILKKHNGAYIYGVGTLKTHRGNGYSQILMNEALRYSNYKSFDYILVKPAEESLYNLYQKQSFDNILNCYNLEITLTKQSTISKTNSTAQTNYHSKLNCTVETNNQSKLNSTVETNNQSKLNSTAQTNNHSKLNSLSQITSNYKIVPDSGNSHLKARESLAKTNFLWPTQILNYSLMEIKSRDGITSYVREFIDQSNNNNFNHIGTAPLFYSAYPIEDNAQIIKVADHNIKTSHQLELSINDITSHFPYATKIVIDFPTHIDLELFSNRTHKPRITKNALIKILNSNPIIKKELLEMYLTLAME